MPQCTVYIHLSQNFFTSHQLTKPVWWGISIRQIVTYMFGIKSLLNVHLQNVNKLKYVNKM